MDPTFDKAIAMKYRGQHRSATGLEFDQLVAAVNVSVQNLAAVVPTDLVDLPTGFTKGSVVFVGTSGVLAEANSHLYWDDTNHRFGINTTPLYVLDVGSSGSASHVRFGPANTDTGGWITSIVANNFSFSSGSAVNAAGNWIGKATDASQIHLGGGNIEFFQDSALVVGNSFVPTRRAYFAGGQLMISSGTSALPGIARNETPSTTTTGIYLTSDGIGLAEAATVLMTLTRAAGIVPGTTAQLPLGDSTHRFTSVFLSGSVQAANNTTAVLARNAANSADINLAQSDSNNDIFYGNANGRDLYLVASRDIYLSVAAGRSGILTSTSSSTTPQAAITQTSTGDAALGFNVPIGSASWTIGVDNSISGAFKVSPVTALDNSGAGITILPAGVNRVIIGDPAGNGPDSGRLQLKIGNQTNIFANVGGVWQSSYTDANNSGTGETDLYSYTAYLNSLGTNGDKLRFSFVGQTVGAAFTTQRVRVYFGGAVILDTGAVSLAVATVPFCVEGWVIRVSNTVVRCTATITTGPGVGTLIALADFQTYTEVIGLDLTTNNILKITGQDSAASNKITAKMGYVEFLPAS